MGAVGPNPSGGRRRVRSKPATAPPEPTGRAEHPGNRPRKPGCFRETPPVATRKALAILVQRFLSLVVTSSSANRGPSDDQQAVRFVKFAGGGGALPPAPEPGPPRRQPVPLSGHGSPGTFAPPGPTSAGARIPSRCSNLSTSCSGPQGGLAKGAVFPSTPVGDSETDGPGVSEAESCADGQH